MHIPRINLPRIRRFKLFKAVGITPIKVIASTISIVFLLPILLTDTPARIDPKHPPKGKLAVMNAT